MTKDEALAVLNGMTYKPGRTFQIQDQGDHILLRISWVGADARRPAPCTTNVLYTCVVPYSDVWTAEGVKQHLLLWLRRLERHELDEWLKFDGERLTDPHAAGVDPDGRTL